MKIFYAVQATGNGHVSRAMELLPYLQQTGTVDVFLSGDNSHLAPELPVKYRSKGLSLYFNATGGLDYWKIIRGFHPLDLRKEINELPVEDYDLVINDFEYITAAACARKNIASIQLGHQASFQSPFTPRPASRNAIGEWILKNYAKTSNYIGLHFDAYDDFILPPVIQQEIRNADPVDHGYVTVYLPSYSLEELEKVFTSFADTNFQIFSKSVNRPYFNGNLKCLPVDKKMFQQSLIHCHGIITGAGFETPAEAIFLGKKLLCIPTRGQYEQACNAAALEQLGVLCLKRIDENFGNAFRQWQQHQKPVSIQFKQCIPAIIEKLLHKHDLREMSRHSLDWA